MDDVTRMRRQNRSAGGARVPRRISRSIAAGGFLAWLAAAVAAPAATPLDVLRHSADVTITIGASASTFDDEDVVAESLASGAVSPVALGSLPTGVDVIGYHFAGGNDHIFSVDTTVALCGGVVATTRDVVRFDAGAGTYAVAFSGAANGVPAGAMVDAIAVGPGGALLLSFDTTVVLGGATIDDEDLATFSGGTFALYLDGSAAGVPSALDLDGADRLAVNGHLLLSFDGSGSIAGVSFDDEDVLEYDAGAGTWELAYDGSAEQPAWAGADLDAVFAVVVMATPTPTATLTVLPTKTAISAETATPTESPTPTALPSKTANDTSTPNPTHTASGTSTAKPTPSITPTGIPSPIPSVTPTGTPATPLPSMTPFCGDAPVASCRTPAVGAKALLLLKDKTPDDKDVLIWKWIKGVTTLKVEFGDPPASDDYTLCIYDGTGLVASAAVPAGGTCGGKPCWAEKPTGFKYKDKDLTPAGVFQVLLKEGLEDGKAKIIVKGKGASLDMPAPPFLDSPVTVQLRNETGGCWGAVYDFPPAIKNEAGIFKDKAD